MAQVFPQRHSLILVNSAWLPDQVMVTLQSDRLRIQVVDNLKDAIERTWQEIPDLLLIPSHQPHTATTTFCQQIRSCFQFPIVILEQDANETERIELLDNGADDVIALNKGHADLLARCHAAIRRVERQLRRDPGAHYLRSMNIQLDIAGRRLLLPQAQINLTLQLTKLLAVLLSHNGTPVSREEIAAYIFNSVTPETLVRVSSLVSALRRRVEDDLGLPPLVVRIWGSGYRLIHNS